MSKKYYVIRKHGNTDVGKIVTVTDNKLAAELFVEVFNDEYYKSGLGAPIPDKGFLLIETYEGIE